MTRPVNSLKRGDASLSNCFQVLYLCCHHQLLINSFHKLTPKYQQSTCNHVYVCTRKSTSSPTNGHYNTFHNFRPPKQADIWHPSSVAITEMSYDSVHVCVHMQYHRIVQVSCAIYGKGRAFLTSPPGRGEVLVLIVCVCLSVCLLPF